MIDLESVSIEGFISWGPYKTVLKLSNMEQCFIIGTVADQTNGSSNGAGKSSLMQAIVWCLSGKTIYSHNPGDKILNWFSSDNAQVILKFKNGDELTRIRTRDSTTELLFRHGTQEIINCTLSTTSNQQKMLDKELKFDYNLFCGSVFFSQYRQPWLSMPDQARRQAFERIMSIDRLSIYAEIAKAKYEKASLEQDKRKLKIENLESNIAESMHRLELIQASSLTFETNRNERQAAKLRHAAEYQEKVDNFKLINISELTKKWNLVSEINNNIDKIKTKSIAIDHEISNIESNRLQAVMKIKETIQEDCKKITQSIKLERNDITNEKDKLVGQAEIKIGSYNVDILELRNQIAKQNGIVSTQHAIIEKWKSKSGKICTECERELPADYTKSKIDGPENIKKKAEHDIIELQHQIDKKEAEVIKLVRIIEQIKSSFTSKLAELIKKEQLAIANIETQQSYDITATNNDSAIVKTNLLAKKAQLEQLVLTTKSRLEAIKPELTINEAKAKNTQRDMLLETIRRAKEEANKIASEKNTHSEMVLDLGIKIRKQEDLAKIEKKDMDLFDIILSHLLYIQKTYTDRKKIKSYLIGRHQPYFNNRLHHYLDLFQLDVKVSLTDSLGIESNLWGYDFQSGGERGRTDLAFMFAVFDLHQGIHGPQSNFLVLDEPEKALDESGRQLLIDVIKNELAPRFESIFIISHSDCFYDVFPHQITVERTDRFSHIIDVR
jgi:DNA repair exonuclease SbcCD ATPase subunit